MLCTEGDSEGDRLFVGEAEGALDSVVGRIEGADEGDCDPVGESEGG